jgi:hypothetical protein
MTAMSRQDPGLDRHRIDRMAIGRLTMGPSKMAMNAAVRTPSPPPSATSILIAALHESRRRDAARVIHRYRHLLADGVEGELSAPVPATQPPARARPAMNDGTRMPRTLGVNCLIALVLLGIGVAHVVGVTALLRAAVLHESQNAIHATRGE